MKIILVTHDYIDVPIPNYSDSIVTHQKVIFILNCETVRLASDWYNYRFVYPNVFLYRK